MKDNEINVLVGGVGGVATCCFLACGTGSGVASFWGHRRWAQKQHPVRAKQGGGRIFLLEV